MPDRTAFATMWAKPTPPVVRLADTFEAGTPVSAIVLYRGGRPGADGRCDLVSTLRVTDEDGGTSVETPPSPLCAQRPPRADATLMGDAVVEFGTDSKPGRLVVSATIVDRVTGTSAVLRTPLTIVTAGTLFHFESVPSTDAMADLIRSRFALGASRERVRHLFVAEGAATLVTHPSVPGVEKYLYDIDLCSYYVWRWNVSADYDDAQHLKQAWVNGEPVFADGTPARKAPRDRIVDGRSKLIKGQRPRPEAFKGESSLAFVLLDLDGDLKTIDDQFLMGAGPTRADPTDLGKLHVYIEVDPWRSIFDADRAEPIARYRGNCAAADAAQAGQRRATGQDATSVEPRR